MTWHGTWPADDCYWGVLDASVLPRNRRSSQAHLGYLFESTLPVPIDDLLTAFAPLGDGRVIACGVERSRLDASRQADWLVLTPTALPDWIAAEIGATDLSKVLASLNLYRGPETPRKVREKRRLQAIAAILLAVAGAGLTAIGLSRRAASLDASVTAYNAASRDALVAALNPEAPPAHPAEEAMLELQLEQRLTLLATTRSATTTHAVDDAGARVAALLAAWPRESEPRVERCLVSGAAIELVAEFDSTEHLDAVLTPLRDHRAWHLPQPNIEQQADGTVRTTFRLVFATEDGP